MEDRVTDRPQQRQVGRERLRGSTHEHRDLSGCGLVDAAGHRSLEHAAALLGDERREPEQLAAIVRAGIDPRRALGQAGEEPVGAGDHLRRQPPVRAGT